MSVWALIMAAGSGNRMGTGDNKIFLSFAGRTLLQHSLHAFLQTGCVDGFAIVAREADFEQIEQSVAGTNCNYVLVPGGKERQHSVLNGLRALPQDCTHVLIHDAARPFVKPAIILEVLRAAQQSGAAIAACAVKDTIKVVRQGAIVHTPNREDLAAAHTPQGFLYSHILQAHEKAEKEGLLCTDDAALLEHYGNPVQIVWDDDANIKITTPHDYAVIQALERQNNMRVGQGYDVHQLVQGLPLILGGVTVEHTHGLLGHSDADVLTHAVIDAIIGACGWGDIGRWFPASDEQYRNISSIALLRHVYDKLQEVGMLVSNIDACIVAQSPRLAAYTPQMCANFAAALHMDEKRINVKCKTTETLGFAGRMEGMEAQAVCMVVERGTL